MLAINESGDRSDASRTGTSTPTSQAGPWLQRALSALARPFALANNDPNTVIAIVHVFVCFDMLGDRESAWIHLQQAISVAQVLEFDKMIQQQCTADEQHDEALRIYFTLYVFYSDDRSRSHAHAIRGQIHLRTRRRDAAAPTGPTE